MSLSIRAESTTPVVDFSLHQETGKTIGHTVVGKDWLIVNTE